MPCSVTAVGGPGSDLQCGDGLVLVHQVGHDGVQRALPLAGRSGAGAGVRPELAQLFVLRLVGVGQGDLAARRGVLAREEDRVGHLLHGQVPDGAQGASTGGTAGELGPAVRAYLGIISSEKRVHRGELVTFIWC